MELILNAGVVAVLVLLGGWFVYDINVLQPRRWAKESAERDVRIREYEEQERARRALELRRAARGPLAERIRNMR